jgi:hypothetical protein
MKHPASFLPLFENKASKEPKNMWFNSPKYTPLGANSDSSTEETKFGSYVDPPQLRQREFLVKISPWLAHFVCFLISSALLFRATQLYERSQSWPGPPVTHEHGKQPKNTMYLCLFMQLTNHRSIAQALAEAGTRYPHTYDGEFFFKSIYRGYPNPALDAAWDNLSNGEL